MAPHGRKCVWVAAIRDPLSMLRSRSRYWTLVLYGRDSICRRKATEHSEGP